jgi:hypothetical protein
MSITIYFVKECGLPLKMSKSSFVPKAQNTPGKLNWQVWQEIRAVLFGHTTNTVFEAKNDEI